MTAGTEETEMDLTKKTYPKCGSGEYAFRSRKRITDELGEPVAVETKYKCKKCGHEWKVRVQMNDNATG